MWDDVQIGYREEHMSSAIFLTDSISHNSKEYWISLDFLEIGMRIHKDTQEGKRLTNMLADKVPQVDINQWLELVALQNIKPEVLMDKIEDTIHRERERAMREKVREIREVLGLGHI